MSQGTTKGIPIDIDDTLANNSDQLVASQKAVKTYMTTALASKANATHNHTASEITDFALAVSTYAPSESASTIGVLINGAATATPNDTDLVATVESSTVKKITWTAIKTFLKTYFDGIYQAVGNYVSTSRTLTINGTTYDLTADRSWTVTGSGASWGSITGTLSSQTDLQSTLDSKVDENVAIVAATKTKVTYDSKGLVTAGADATTADINDSTNRRYVTDAQLTVLGNTSNTNTGDQTSIVGISGTKAQFDTACSDGNFLYTGDVTQYTDELAQDAVGTILLDSATIDFTYDDATPNITAIVKDSSLGLAKLSATGTQNNTTFLRGDNTWAIPTASVSYTLNFGLAGDLTTGANTNNNNITGFSFSYAANSVYKVEIIGAVQAAATTTGYGFSMDVSTAVTQTWLTYVNASSATGGATVGYSRADAVSAGVTSAIAEANQTIPFFANGLLITGANTGTCQVVFRSETTAATTLKAGTRILVLQVA